MQKAYYKQKMASEKSAKTPAVLDFNTQHHELALEGTQRQDSAKPPHRKWNAPRPTENDTHTLTPDLNRGMDDGMDRVDVNAHLDDTGISHGTKQGLMRAHGTDRGTSQARMETPRESDKLTPGAVSPRNRRKKSPRFQTDRVQTEIHTRTRNTTAF